MPNFNDFKILEKLINSYRNMSKPDKFGHIITIGFALAIAFFPYYFGYQTSIDVLKDFFTKIQASNLYHLMLLFVSCLLAVVWVIAGVSETYFIKKHYLLAADQIRTNLAATNGGGIWRRRERNRGHAAPVSLWRKQIRTVGRQSRGRGTQRVPRGIFAPRQARSATK